MPTRLPPAAEIGASRKRLLERRLRAWYDRHRRDLPWRHTHDPYAIWVSEVMLQQTQVATVIPYFTRFMAAFPDVATLARADERDVLRSWEGLGYYRRARQLHLAAQVVVQRHAGRFPRRIEDVRQLPGIGRYTAGAILSIAFDMSEPILEANTVRLLSRLVAFDGDSASGAGRRVLWQVAGSILPKRGCREFNSALMELGSLICTPRNPQCDACPLGGLCRARKLGRQEQIPPPLRKRPAEPVHEASVVVWRQGRVLVRKRQHGERWAGLWDFLRFELSEQVGPALNRELRDKVRKQSGLSVTGPRHLATLKHGVTRFRITLDCYAARSNAINASLVDGAWRWVRPAELDDFPLSVTGRKLSRLLLASKGQESSTR